MNSSSLLASAHAITFLCTTGLHHVSNVKMCGEISPVSSSCSYKVISPHPCSPHAHRELITLSFHLQDMRFSLQYYNPSSRPTCTFFHILAGTYKKILSVQSYFPWHILQFALLLPTSSSLPPQPTWNQKLVFTYT